MNPEIQLLVGCLVVSIALSYAWWVSLRVTCLKEEIFAIRDRLFDDALEQCRLADPAYVDARGRLNMLIRFAHMWNFPVFIAVLVSPSPGRKRIESEDAQFDAFIQTAIDEASTRYVMYMLTSTLTGRFVAIFAVTLMPWIAITSWLKRRVYRLIETQADIPEEDLRHFA